MAKKFVNSEVIMVDMARLSFPNLVVKGEFNGETNSKFDAVLICDDKVSPKTLKQLQLAAKGAIESALDKNPQDRYMALKNDVIRDRMDSNREEYKGTWTVKGSNKRRPYMLDAVGNRLDNSPEGLERARELFYSGCRTKSKVRFYAGKGKFGPMLGCELQAIQFREDDEPLGSGSASFEEATEGFEVTEDVFESDDFGADAEENDNEDMFG